MGANLSALRSILFPKIFLSTKSPTLIFLYLKTLLDMFLILLFELTFLSWPYLLFLKVILGPWHDIFSLSLLLVPPLRVGSNTSVGITASPLYISEKWGFSSGGPRCSLHC